MITKTIEYTNPVLFTEVTANNVQLNKTFELINGEVKKTVNANMSTGSFKVFQVNNVMDLDNYLNTLSSNQAIIAGIPKNNLLQGTIVPSGGELLEYNAISRTNSYFTEAKTSLSMFDLDFDESMPEIMKQIKSPKDFFNEMLKIIPELSEIELFIRPSSSSGIFNTLNNQYVYKDSNSYHMYIAFENCTKENLNNFIEWFKRKALEVGLWYGKIYKNGSIAFKTLIDLSPITSLCSRIIFEASPTVLTPLELRPQPTEFFNKGSKIALDLSRYNPNELPDYRSSFEDYKKSLAPQIEKIKSEYFEKKEKQLIENGIEKNEAKEIVKKFLNENKISCNDFLIKADGTKINILDAILSPTREYFNDIIDETKKSKTYIKQKGIFDAELFSFSSGGISYKINYTFEDIKKSY